MADDKAREDAPEDEPGEAAEGLTASPDDEVAAALLEQHPESTFVDSHGQAVVYVDRARWLDAARFLRDEQQFTQCVDVTAVDHLLDELRPEVTGVVLERFEVVANYLSHEHNRRLRAVAEIPADDPTIASLTEIFPGVNIAEREVYDLFGIEFEGHPALARLMMPDDWIGHPLRKDDPPAQVPVTFKEDPGPR